MANRQATESFLVAQFRDFYAEIVRLKRMIHFRTVSAQQETVIWQRLLTMLEKQGLAAERMGAPQATYYEEAQYVMAALGDEVFLNLDWRGREYWKRNLVESRLFRSHVAGERFFEQVDKLLAERDPAFADLAAVYLLALSLGFRGKYRGSDDGGRLAHYRRALFQFVEGHEPELAKSTDTLCPAALVNTLEDERIRLLPQVRGWVWGLVLAVLAYVVISHEVWDLSTRSLRRVIAQLLGTA